MNKVPSTFGISIPCYGEEKNIQRILDIASSCIFRGSRAKRLVLVVDDSTDKTGDIIASFSERSPVPIKLIHRKKRKGKSSAINESLDCLKDVDRIVLVSADVGPESDCIPLLLAAMDDPAVGVVAGRVIPEGPSHLPSVRASRILWQIHHLMALDYPKSTEITVFRNGIGRLDEKGLVDEAEIEMLATQKGWRIRYVPEAKIHSPSPLTLRDYILQRSRVALGYLKLFSRTGYRMPTMCWRMRFRYLWRLIKTEKIAWRDLWLTLGLEAIVAVNARIRFALGKENSGIWRQTASTRRVEQANP